MAVLILIGTCPAFAQDVQEDLEGLIRETAYSITRISGKSKENILADNEFLPAGSSLSDWIAVVLAFSNEEEAYGTYLKNLEKYVKDEYKKNGFLDQYKATEYHRIALTVLTLGGNPKEFGGVNLIAEGTYDFHSGSPGQQGANGLAYALLALDSKNYEIPEDAAYTREWMVKELLSLKGRHGGIALEKDSESNVDITAMALQALANYQEQPEVKEVVETSLSWLSDQMTEQASFMAYESESSESVAQVILALCALGMDPEEDARFIINDTTLLDGLNRFRTEDGMYKHTTSDEEGDLLATQQALLALEAVHCLRTEGRWILDYTEYELDTIQENHIFTVVGIGAVIIVLIVIIAAVSLQKKKAQERDRRYV